MSNLEYYHTTTADEWLEEELEISPAGTILHKEIEEEEHIQSVIDQIVYGNSSSEPYYEDY